MLENVCGQTLLILTSRANAIISEILRLAPHVPSVFKLEDKAMIKKYGEILIDLNEVSKADLLQTKIDKNQVRNFFPIFFFKINL